MTIARDQLSNADATIVAAIEQAISALMVARDLLDRFQVMIRSKTNADLDPWIREAAGSFVASLASGIVADHTAVAAAMTEPRSNGETEGQITRPKLMKRRMYNRASSISSRLGYAPPNRQIRPAPKI